MKPYTGQLVLYQSESFAMTPPFAAIVARNLGGDVVNLSVLDGNKAAWSPKLKVAYNVKGELGTWRYQEDVLAAGVDA